MKYDYKKSLPLFFLISLPLSVLLLTGCAKPSPPVPTVSNVTSTEVQPTTSALTTPNETSSKINDEWCTKDHFFLLGASPEEKRRMELFGIINKDVLELNVDLCHMRATEPRKRYVEEWLSKDKTVDITYSYGEGIERPEYLVSWISSDGESCLMSTSTFDLALKDMDMQKVGFWKCNQRFVAQKCDDDKTKTCERGKYLQ